MFTKESQKIDLFNFQNYTTFKDNTARKISPHHKFGGVFKILTKQPMVQHNEYDGKKSEEWMLRHEDNTRVEFDVYYSIYHLCISTFKNHLTSIKSTFSIDCCIVFNQYFFYNIHQTRKLNHKF